MSQYIQKLAPVALLALVPACGLITAGVSLPEAFTHNNNLGLKGAVTDDQNRPLDDVLVTVKREYYLWHADASYPEFDTQTLIANHDFEVPQRRAHELTFTFHKAGYADQTLIVGQFAIKADYPWIEGTQWPLNQPVRVTLQASSRPPPTLRWIALEVDYTDPAKIPVIDLTKTTNVGFSRDSTIDMSRDALSILNAPAKPPPHTLYADIQRQPTKTTGIEHRVDPLDLNLPASFTFRLADPDAGFILFKPDAGASPLTQMPLAPAAGYAPELAIPGTRLRQIRDRQSQIVSDRNEFFFFHANNTYGKAALSWTRSTDETGPLKLFLVLILQPDGSPNLATPF